MARIYNHKLVSGILCYTPEEICNLYSSNKLTLKKVNKWLKNGLPIISDGRPPLIAGPELIKFLKKINNASKQDLNFEEFFCCACKMAHIPLGRKISLEQRNCFIRAKGICPATKKSMIKVFKLSDFGKIKKFFIVAEEKRLYDSYSPLLNSRLSEETPQQLKLIP